MSKRHGDPSYEDLRDAGYLTEAIINYVALLGWSPRGEIAEREFFTLDELVKAFDIAGISKSPAIFDIEKLKYFNAQYIREMSPERFAEVARPFIRQAVKRESIDPDKIAALLQQRTEILTDIPAKLDFFDELPEYDIECYTNKKSKTNPEVSLRVLKEALPKLEALEPWENESLKECMTAMAAEMEMKNATVMWPIRIAVSGRLVTPGGVTELCDILGKEESLARIRRGIEKLEQ
jgi:glutamyl-tRNA synthetase